MSVNSHILVLLLDSSFERRINSLGRGMLVQRRVGGHEDQKSEPNLAGLCKCLGGVRVYALS